MHVVRPQVACRWIHVSSGSLYSQLCRSCLESSIAALFRCRNYYLIGICINDEIGIMGHHDDLSPPLRTAEVRHEFAVYRVRIKILLRLVDQQGSSILSVQG